MDTEAEAEAEAIAGGGGGGGTGAGAGAEAKSNGEVDAEGNTGVDADAEADVDDVLFAWVGGAEDLSYSHNMPYQAIIAWLASSKFLVTAWLAQVKFSVKTWVKIFSSERFLFNDIFLKKKNLPLLPSSKCILHLLNAW